MTTLLLCFLACHALPSHHWLPDRAGAEVRVTLPAPPQGGADTRAVFVYVDLDDDPAADRMLSVTWGGAWELDDETTSGSFQTERARGRLGADGAVVGLPADTFDGARAIWSWDSGAGVTVQLNDQVVPFP